jgi:hypothetical protein
MKLGRTPDYELQILSAELYDWANRVERLMSVDPYLAEIVGLAELADGIDELSRQVSTAAMSAGYLRNALETLADLDEPKIRDRPSDK